MTINKWALIGRINRKLAKDGEKLCVSRGQQMRIDVGDLYIVDVSGNFVVREDIDLEELGHDLGVLA